MLTVLRAFCPWLCRREPSQCWWVWVDGEWQAKTLPVNQQGCLAPLLHSLGDEKCVILPWGISPRRCLRPPSTVPSPPRPPLLLQFVYTIPSGLSLWKCPLLFPLLHIFIHLFAYQPQLSSSTPAASFHLLFFLWICSSAVPHSFTLQPCASSIHSSFLSKLVKYKKNASKQQMSVVAV